MLTKFNEFLNENKKWAGMTLKALKDLHIQMLSNRNRTEKDEAEIEKLGNFISKKAEQERKELRDSPFYDMLVGRRTNKEMITLYTGSHYSYKEKNREAWSEINNLLLSKENPLFTEFAREDLYLDSNSGGEGFVSIVQSSSTILPPISYKKAQKLNDWLRTHIKANSGDLLIYISDYVFKK